MLKITGVLFAVLFFGVVASAEESPDVWWVKMFGGSGSDGANSVRLVSDGFIVAGATQSYGGGNRSYGGSFEDAWLIKTDFDGNERWNRTFGGSSYDGANSVVETSDGYAVVGTTSSYGSGGDDAWLIKTDFDGNERWNRTFGGSGHDHGNSVLKTLDGYAIVGSTSSYGSDDRDGWLIKTDFKGNEVWNKTFDGKLAAISQISDGFMLAGSTSSYGSGKTDAWLIKTDLNGNEEWNKTYGSSRAERINSLQSTSDGYIIAGSVDFRLNAYTENKAWLIKTDLNGIEQWNRTYGFAGAGQIVKADEGGYILTGTTEQRPPNHTDGWLMKVDSQGNEVWNKTFGGYDYDSVESLHKTSDGYIITGTTDSYDSDGWQAWLLKFSKEPIKNEKLTSTPFEKNDSHRVSPGFKVFLGLTGLVIALYLLNSLRRKQ